MQKFVPICQDALASRALECEELRDSASGLQIFCNVSDGSKLVVSFQEHLAYRLLDEGDALDTVNQLTKSGYAGKHLYRIENSEFIEWFHKQSYEVRRGDEISHYAIITANDIIDVITFDSPSLQFTSD